MPPIHLLTDQQISFFETFGYLGFPGLMADRIDEIIREFEVTEDMPQKSCATAITANSAVPKAKLNRLSRI